MTDSEERWLRETVAFLEEATRRPGVPVGDIEWVLDRCRDSLKYPGDIQTRSLEQLRVELSRLEEEWPGLLPDRLLVLDDEGWLSETIGVLHEALRQGAVPAADIEWLLIRCRDARRYFGDALAWSISRLRVEVATLAVAHPGLIPGHLIGPSAP